MKYVLYGFLIPLLLVLGFAALGALSTCKVKAAGKGLTKSSLLDDLKSKPHCNQLLGVTTKGATEGAVTHYAQAFLEVDTTTGTVAKVRQIYFLVVNEGKETERAFYDVQSIPTAEVDAAVASKTRVP